MPVRERLRDLRVLIRGAGELGSAVASHLAHQGCENIVLVDLPFPKAVRRNVCFSEAAFEHAKTVDGVTARLAMSVREIHTVLARGDLALTTFPLNEVLAAYRPHVYVEAAMLKRNWGLSTSIAPLVVALGPGYQAGKDCHVVVETVRGPQLGRILEGGEELAPAPPAIIMGYSQERVIKAQYRGIFHTSHRIGDRVEQGEKVGFISLVVAREDLYRGVPVDDDFPVVARVSGVIRGLLRDSVPVEVGDKIGDVDPRGVTEDLHHISDKARRVAEGVLEAIVLHLPTLAPGQLVEAR